MARRRSSGWLPLILLPAALLLVAIPGFFVAREIASEPLHPGLESVPSVTSEGPAAKWAAPVKQAREAVRASIADESLPGVSVAVVVNGQLVWAEGFGFANLESREPVRPDDRFRIGTASVALTSAAAGLLLEQGRLNLDDVIQTYVPAFPRKQWPVTLRHVMGHTAGLVNDGGDEGPLFANHCERPEEALQYFAEQPLEFQPGAHFSESRYGWILVSAAIEAAAGDAFVAFMRRHVFEPLGMAETAVDPASQGQVVSYFPRFAADPKYGLHLMRPLDYSCYSGASVFVSTPSDLVRFAAGIAGGKLLKPATVELLQTSQRLASDKETGYGLGWYVRTVDMAGKQTRIVGADGDLLGGMMATLLVAPEYGVAIAVTSNISYAGTFSLAVRIAAGFAELR